MRAYNYLPLMLLLAATTCCCLAASSSSSKKSTKESAAAAAASKQHDELLSITHPAASAKVSARTDSSSSSSSASSGASASSSAAASGSSSASSAAASSSPISHKESSKSREPSAATNQAAAAAAAAEADMIDSALDAQQQEHQLQQQLREDQQQAAADKKQGEQPGEGDSMDSLVGSDEYVQIKPEEMDLSNGKDMDPTMSLVQSADQQSSPAEHKAVDDELNAHLAQESVYHPAIVPLKGGPSRPMMEGPARAKSYHGQHHYAPLQAMHPMPPAAPAASYPRPLPAPRPHSGAAPYQAKGPHHQPQPGYTALKGKLTGINSLISQYPHPAPGYPHQGPKHLPRGAAAGYAAFRDFVRAHANKYKHAAAAAAASAPTVPLSMPELVAPGKDYSKELPQPAFVAPPPAPAGGYPGPAASGNKAPGYGSSAAPTAPARPAGPQYGGQAPKAQRLTVAQAYIPQLSPAPAPASYGSGSSPSQQSGYGANPILAGLYGQHAPQGAGKPEYSQDFGMVIHYPQATVYTEPMSVDQLHKLTGAGITQVLAQLQQNLAHGHRDESNTIRPNNAHHIGNGLHIHAKEFYAPGKSGHYVPTTAAIISGPAPAKASASGYDQPAASEYQSQGGDAGGYAALSMGPGLGAGYERVKQAVAAGQERYNNRYPAPQGGAVKGPAGVASDYGKQAAPQAASYGAGNGQYGGGADGLGAITNYLGAELDALYKSNDGLAKPMEPEAYAAKSPAHSGRGPARYPSSESAIENQPPRGIPMGYGPGPIPYGPYNPMQQSRSPRAPVYAMPGAAMLRGPPNRYHAGPRGQRGPRRGHHGLRHARYPGGGRHPMMPVAPPAGPYQTQSSYQPRHPKQHPQMQGAGSYRQHQPSGGYSKPQASQAYRQQQQMQHQQQQQQQAQYHQATEQALNQQMLQLMHDFNSGDEQYNVKSQPSQPANQGYPHKVMQKYSQYRQQGAAGYAAQQGQQQSAYAQADGIEIPQGPNDQIGEIAELIEALKNTLESRKPESESGQYGSAPAANGAKQPAANLEDIRYLTTVLGQMPTYPIQVPVGTEGARPDAGAYDQAKKGSADAYGQQAAAAAPAQEQQQAAYQQQQQQQAQQQAYEQAPAAAQYQQAGPVAKQADQASYQSGAASADAYGQQQQQQQSSQGQADHYSAAMQQVRSALAQTQVQTGAYGQHVVSGTYPQQASAAPSAPEQQSGYSNSEHTQVINHLVPVAQQQPLHQSSQSYSADQTHQQQPANQIAVSAPTDAQYQQAQSLSSFVDSLPTDYQELLRQPALLDGQSGGQQLALLGQEQSQYTPSSNATTSAAGSAHGQPSSYGTYQLAQQQTHSSHAHQAVASGHQAYQQQQQPSAGAKVSSQHDANNNAAQQQSQQYAATVKK